MADTPDLETLAQKVIALEKAHADQKREIAELKKEVAELKRNSRSSMGGNH